MAYEFPRTFLSVLNLVLLHTASDCSLEYRQPKEFIIRHLSSTDPFTFWTLKNECILDICGNIWDTLFFLSIESIPLTDFDCIYSYITHHCLIKEHLSFYLLSLLHLNIMFSVFISDLTYGKVFFMAKQYCTWATLMFNFQRQ